MSMGLLDRVAAVEAAVDAHFHTQTFGWALESAATFESAPNGVHGVVELDRMRQQLQGI